MGNACVVIIIITSALHPLWCYIFVGILDWDIKGTGMALVITMALNTIMSTWYLWVFHPYPKANFWINKSCFNPKGLKQYLKFTIGASILELAELFGYEINSFVALKLDDDSYSAYVLLMHIQEFCYAIPTGFIQAITILLAEFISDIFFAIIYCIFNIVKFRFYISIVISKS